MLRNIPFSPIKHHLKKRVQRVLETPNSGETSMIFHHGSTMGKVKAPAPGSSHEDPAGRDTSTCLFLGGGNTMIFGIFTPMLGEMIQFDESTTKKDGR